MSSLRLFGTTTSPYVRRVRIVAAELGLECDLVNTFTPEGDKEMRAASPIWKVPTVQLEPGEIVYDSHAITEVLMHRHGAGPMAPFDPYDVPSRNTISVIDGALDALINVFYLGRDNISPEQSSYAAKQVDRAAASLGWLEARASELGEGDAFGLVHVALVSTIDWIRFRETAPLADYPALAAASDRWSERASVVATMPSS